MHIPENLPTHIEPHIRKAGEIVLSYYGKELHKTYKERSGFATQADIASEQYLIQELGKVIPHAAFFAEESGKSGDGDYCWVIDPLDGTINFAHHIPYFCVSVALTYKDKPIFGMIFDPIHNELFWAQESQGAYLNGERITMRATQDLSDVVMVVGLPFVMDEQYMQLIENIRALKKVTYRLRTFGAVALDQVYIASGRLDASILSGQYWWDIAAGMVIVQQAGGTVTTFEGDPVTPAFRTYLAANQNVHAAVTTIILKK